MVAGHQRVGQVGHHRFDTPVRIGRNVEVGRRDQGDAQSLPRVATRFNRFGEHPTPCYRIGCRDYCFIDRHCQVLGGGQLLTMSVRWNARHP